MLGECHLHIGCLPVWLYLQELKEEQRLLPRQRQEGAGRAPAPLPCHPSLSGRCVSNLFLGTSDNRDSTSARRQHWPGPAAPAGAAPYLQGFNLSPMVLGFPSLRKDFSVSAFLESFHIFDPFAHLPSLTEISPQSYFPDQTRCCCLLLDPFPTALTWN